MRSRVRAWSLWWLLVLGCGSTSKDQTLPLPPVEAAAGGAGAPAPVDTSRYSWSECGRIEPSSFVRGAGYASDGSVITVEGSGRVRLFPSDSNVATTLLPDRGTDIQSHLPVTPSSDGVFLAFGSQVYAREDRTPIVAGSADLVRVDGVGAEAEGCLGYTQLALDSAHLATRDQDSVCLWESVGGALMASFALEPGEGILLPDTVLGQQHFRAVRGDTLLSFDLTGELLTSIALTPLLREGEEGLQTSFSPDGRHLALQLLDRTLGTGRLVVLDAASGELVWQRELTWVGLSDFVISLDGSALWLSHDAVLDLSDGSVIADDVGDLFGSTPVLGAGGRRLLSVGEQVAEWDVEQGELLRLYGSHRESIRDLDITPDGRHLASHGDLAVTWQLNAEDFGRSLPLFRGSAPDSSWNVALAPDGDVMSVSGDNVMFFTRQGQHWYVGQPPTDVGCLSADWSFSPLGNTAAGTHYRGSVELVDTAKLVLGASLGTSNCGGGVAFSPDGTRLATASLEVFDTTSWSRLHGSPPPQSVPLYGNAEDDVVFSPDGGELLLTRCDDHNQDCRATRYRSADGSKVADVPGLSGEQVRYAPDGQWVVSKGLLVHLPTGKSQELTVGSQVAVFTPEGDVISGEGDGALVKHCLVK